MIGAVGIIALPFVALLVFSPVVRRLALRNASRRPRETALVILGSLLGTAILTGSFVVGDTLEASLRRLAHTQLGPIDEVVVVPDATIVPDVVSRIEGSGAEIDGVLPMRILNVSATTTTGERLAVPRTQLVEVDFDLARRFGGDEAATGIAGQTPVPGRTIVTVDLAKRLEVQAGSTIEVFAYGTSQRLVVAGVIDTFGLAGYWHGFENESRNAFVIPGTIEGLGQGAFAGGGLRFERPIDVVVVSNRGGVEDGALRTSEVTQQLDTALEGTGAEVRAAKQDALSSAADSGEQFSTLFAAMGSFGVVAGILLLVNIFVMLAEERRSELGMLRAIGMRRSRLVVAFSTEGFLYAIGSSVAGAVAGIGVGQAIASVASGIFASSQAQFRLDLQFAATPASVQRGLAIGFLISMATILATSVRISRFNVIAAIRDAPVPQIRRHRVWTLVAGGAVALLGALWVASAVGSSEPFGMLLAPLLIVAGLVPVADRLVTPRLALSAAATLGLVWGVVGMRFFSNASDDSSLMLFVAQGIVLTASSVLLVSQNQETLAGLIRRLGGGTRGLGVRLGLAYPLARRFRTGMTLAMYTLVVFTITFITVFTAIISQQIQDFARSASGGFDVLVVSNPTNPIPQDDLASREGVEAAAVLHSSYAQFALDDPTQLRPGGISAFDEAFVDIGPPSLSDHDERFESDEETYRAVLDDPSLVIVPSFFLSNRRASGPPRRVVDIGDEITIINPFSGASTTATVVGLVSGSLAQGALYGIDGAREVFGQDLVATPALLATGDADPVRFAARLSADYVQHGADANAITDLLVGARATELRFFGLIRGYLALGLVVGIAGLGVVMVRAVRERRRQIGVLRALGFDARIVRRAFIVESGFVALEGVLIGVVLALITSYSLVAMSDVFGGNLVWQVPVGSVAMLVVGTLVMSLIATAAPSQAASRIRPAVALRIAD